MELPNRIIDNLVLLGIQNDVTPFQAQFLMVAINCPTERLEALSPRELADVRDLALRQRRDGRAREMSFVAIASGRQPFEIEV